MGRFFRAARFGAGQSPRRVGRKRGPFKAPLRAVSYGPSLSVRKGRKAPSRERAMGGRIFSKFRSRHYWRDSSRGQDNVRTTTTRILTRHDRSEPHVLPRDVLVTVRSATSL